MKKLFEKPLFVSLSVAVFFILSAFTFINFLYCAADCVGSFVSGSPDIAVRDALRSMPIILSFFLSLSGLLTVQAFYRNESPMVLKRRAKRHACISVILGGIIILYVMIMRLTGRYLSLVEGSPSRLYPLDAVIYALLFILFGINVTAFLKKNNGFSGVSRIPIPQKGRWFFNIFRGFWLVISLYAFAAFFFGLFILDFKNGYLPYTLALLFVYLTAFLSMVVWEFYYNNLTQENRKRQLLPLALISLAVSLMADILYALMLKNNLDGPGNVGQGLFPVAFTAKVNLATMLVTVMPLMVSLTALVKGLVRRRRSKGGL